MVKLCYALFPVPETEIGNFVKIQARVEMPWLEFFQQLKGLENPFFFPEFNSAWMHRSYDTSDTVCDRHGFEGFLLFNHVC